MVSDDERRRAARRVAELRERRQRQTTRAARPVTALHYLVATACRSWRGSSAVTRPVTALHYWVVGMAGLAIVALLFGGWVVLAPADASSEERPLLLRGLMGNLLFQESSGQ